MGTESHEAQPTDGTNAAGRTQEQPRPFGYSFIVDKSESDERIRNFPVSRR